MDFAKEPKTLISLCTGMRGIERGIERTGVDVRVECYVEIEAFIIENLVQQMEQGVLAEAPVWSNLKTFNARPFRGMVDIITGGFPCQPFSVAGKRGGGEDPRHLWPYIGKGETSIVGTIKPFCCFFENVPGLLTLGYREVRSDLEQLGYKVEEGIFSAEEVGAPHQRKRLFILAVENSFCSGVRNFSEQIGGDSRIKNVRQGDWKECSVRIEPTSELANTNDNGERTQPRDFQGKSQEIEGTEQRKERNETFGKRSRPKSSQLSQLANPTEQRLPESGQTGIRELQKERGEGIHDRPEQSGDELADTSSARNAVRISGPEQGEEGNAGIIDNNCLQTRWPSKPGEEQYEWEAPRVESSLGYAINGYNFREDLLRMAGNGVVEQTAALAWKTLWNKFL